MENVQLVLLFFAGDSCLLSLYMFVWNKLSLRSRTFHAHSIFKTCVQRRKDHFGLFLNTNTPSGRMLIKLIVVDSHHFIRYKCKITRCLDPEFISTVVLDDNEKLSIKKVLEVLISVGTFTSTSSFDMQSFQFVRMNELKKSIPKGLQLFYFYIKCLLMFHKMSTFCWNSKLLHTMRCL